MRIKPEELERFAGEKASQSLREELAITRMALEKVMNNQVITDERRLCLVVEAVRTIERLVLSINALQGAET